MTVFGAISPRWLARTLSGGLVPAGLRERGPGHFGRSLPWADSFENLRGACVQIVHGGSR